MGPWLADPDVTLYHGDVLATLRDLEAESVDCVVTSPPYWGLRDYGTGAWEGGDAECDHRVREDARVESSTLDGGKATTGHQREGFKDVCPRCGATRIDRQLGLEPTPEQYVERMVEVFREVRRVLAAHGTVWLNLGDSYAAANNRNDGTRQVGSQSDSERDSSLQFNQGTYRKIPGLKPKDLVGIPWRVAFALQQPYYTGTIRKETDRVWLAAMVEAEGCMFIHKRKAGQSNGQGYERKNDSYGAGLEVASTDRAIVERCLEIAGKGSIGAVERGTDVRRRQTLYRWMLRSNECRDIIHELYPHFIAKQHEARLILGCPSSGADAAKAHESLKAIHQGRESNIDFPAPPTLYEPGWYVRSDIVWSKLNPMPESVTDRPTKAHEYVFLLSKQARYFFDQEAVRETYERGANVYGYRGGGPNSESAAAYLNQNGPQDNSNARGPDGRRKTTVQAAGGSIQHRDGERWPNGGRNIRSVWEIATQPYPEAHFATFPEELARRCIAAGTSERGKCPECGAPWVRVIEVTRDVENLKRFDGYRPRWDTEYEGKSTAEDSPYSRPASGMYADTLSKKREMMGWEQSCDCYDGTVAITDVRPCVVLDPFVGSGTVCYVARKLGRHAIGIDLNAEYLALAAKRLQQQSLFA